MEELEVRVERLEEDMYQTQVDLGEAELDIDSLEFSLQETVEVVSIVLPLICFKVSGIGLLTMHKFGLHVVFRGMTCFFDVRLYSQMLSIQAFGFFR